MPLSLSQAAFLGGILESIVYGAYLRTFYKCMAVQYRRWRRGDRLWLHCCMTVLLYILVTMHFVDDLRRFYHTFTAFQTSEAVTIYCQNHTTFSALFENSLYISVTLLSDLYIVYRCWIVWGCFYLYSRSYALILVPCALFVTDIVLGIWSLRSLSMVNTQDPIFAQQVSLHVKYFYSITLAVNLLSTILIAVRIWSIRWFSRSQLAGSSFSVLSNVATICIESAAAYSALLIALLAADLHSSNAMFTVLWVMPSSIGLIFSYVILRVSSGVSSDQ